jgi:hypothetical protein
MSICAEISETARRISGIWKIRSFDDMVGGEEKEKRKY